MGILLVCIDLAARGTVRGKLGGRYAGFAFDFGRAQVNVEGTLNILEALKVPKPTRCPALT